MLQPKRTIQRLSLIDKHLGNPYNINMNFDKSNLFFTGCTHFGHEKIIGYCDRPFTSVHEMNKALTENWNRVVPPDGIVYHLGDFCWGSVEHYGIRLNGHIILVKGNHDHYKNPKNTPKYTYEPSYLEKTVEERLCVMSHYPIVSWNKQRHGSYHLFSHCHGTLQPFIERNMTNARMLDVGVDSVAKIFGTGLPEDYRPISYAEVETFMSPKSGVHNIDHHKPQEVK